MIRAGIGQTFEAFGVGLFRLHWLLTVMAFMSFSMNFTVLPIVAFDLGGTNSSVALAMAGNGIAWFFIGPFAGALTDRLSKRRLIVLAQTAIAINYALIGFLILIGRIEVIWLTLSTCFSAHVSPSLDRRVARMSPTSFPGGWSATGSRCCRPDSRSRSRSGRCWVRCCCLPRSSGRTARTSSWPGFWW